MVLDMLDDDNDTAADDDDTDEPEFKINRRDR